jgi:hypothetical protein
MIFFIEWLGLKMKGKVAPMPNEVTCQKGVWGSGSIAPSFLTSVLDGVKQLALQSGCLTHGETAPSTNCIGNGVGSSARVGAVKKKKIVCPC